MFTSERFDLELERDRDLDLETEFVGERDFRLLLYDFTAGELFLTLSLPTTITPTPTSGSKFRVS